MTENQSTPSGFRAGFIAVVGRPNVGKSTLINALLGAKVSIVTPKPQTTRTRISGILNLPNAQIVLVDTPGFCGPDTALDKALRRVTGHAAQEADITLVVSEVASVNRRIAAAGGDARLLIDERDKEVLRLAASTDHPLVIALNKVDCLNRKEALLPVLSAYNEKYNPTALVPISALEGEGLDDLVAELVRLLPESDRLFPEDMHTDQAERFLCGELVREQMLMHLRDEVPHRSVVIIDEFDDGREDSEEEPNDEESEDSEEAVDAPVRVRTQSNADAICHLEGRIVVERESQKGIVVGRNGEQIKAISTAARLEMEQLLGCRVFLRLRVVVDPNWTQSMRAVQNYGYGVIE